MVRAGARHNREHDMGQISSQLAQAEPADHVATKRATGKGKRKRRKQEEPREEPQEEVALEEQVLNQERESAQALIQLAQGSSAQAGAPQHGGGSPVTPVGNSRHSRHRYGPDMTSQDILSQELSSEGRTTKRLKTRSKKKKTRDALRSEVQSALYQDEPSTPAAQRATTPIEELSLPWQQTSHPLDDVSTDADVEEIAEGTQDVHQSEKARNEIPETSPARSELHLSEAQANPFELPPYSASQRQRALEESGHRNTSTRKRKRVTERDANPSAANAIAETWPQVPLKYSKPQQDERSAGEENVQAGLDGLPLEIQHGSIDGANAEDLEMAIDPALSNMGASALNTKSPVENGQLPKRRRASGPKKAGKKRRMGDKAGTIHEPVVDDDEVPYYSPYAGHHNQLHPQSATFPVDQDFERPPSIRTKISQSRNGVPEKKNPSQSKQVQDMDPKRRKQEISNAKGHLGPKEYALVEAYRDNYCRDHGIGHRDFNALIQTQLRGNSNVKAMFADFQEMFPTQQVTYIQRALRRKFHNFSARGTWTAEEDDELKNAVAEKGMSWKAVGEMIERYPEDCRDRWRNYLTRENRVTDQWTEAEVLNLASAIYDCVQTMKVERRQSKEAKFGHDAPYSDDEWDEDVAPLKLLNWQAVSDRMGSHGGTRSRLQCSGKWGKFGDEERERLLRNVRTSQQPQNLQGQADGNLNPSGWRMKKASKKVANMLPGDRYDLLQLLLHSGALSEGNIPWRSLGEPWWQERWTVTDRKAAWLMMKLELPDSENMDYRDVVYNLMNPLLQQDLSQRWDSTNYKTTPDPRSGRPKPGKVGKKTEQGKGKRKRKRKSQSKVDSTDSESELFLSSDRPEPIPNGQPTQGNESSDGGGDPSYQPHSHQPTSGEGVASSSRYGFDPRLTQDKRQPAGSDADGDNNVDGDMDSLFEDGEEQDGDSYQKTAYHDARVAPDLARRVLSLQDVE